jgi:hypothetical protein
MAQQSARRGWENQSVPTCFKHAHVIWTRSANSHTGRQHTIAAPEAGQMAASDYAQQRSRSFPLPGAGRPQMEPEAFQSLPSSPVMRGGAVSRCPKAARTGGGSAAVPLNR